MHLTTIASVHHGAPLHHLRFHPTLPLLATVDAHHVAVHVWTWRAGELLRLGSIGEPGVARVPDSIGRLQRGRDIDWHPTRPWLAVAGAQGVQLWMCDLAAGVQLLRTCGVMPPCERVVEDTLYWQSSNGGEMQPVTRHRTIPRELPGYMHVGFSPSGRSLWASAVDARDEEVRDGLASDWFDLDDPAHATQVWRWDTDLALHPEGELMAAFESNQGATLLRFARVNDGPAGESIETLRRALVLDADGYCDLTFSPRGDRFLFHGNAYEGFCQVHAFPSLERVCIVPLDGWKETLEKRLPPSWNDYCPFFESLAFSPDNEGLLIGLRSGHLVDLDLRTLEPRDHVLLLDRPLSAFRVRAHDGLLAVTDLDGLLRLYQLPHPAAHPDTTSRPLTRSFVDATAPATRYAPWDDLSLTDGLREWSDASLDTSDLPDSAPTWARLGAALRACVASEDEPTT